MKAGLFIVQCLIFTTAWAQGQNHSNNQFFVKHLSVEEGLSQPTVNAIMRGSRGFIWIATEDGLNRYDGEQFKIYRHNPKDTASISHSVVYTLLEDQITRNIWVGTATGLDYYDRSTERFTHIPAVNKPGSAYSDLAIDYDRNTLWIANGVGGVRYLNIKDGIIHDLDHPDLKDIVAWTLKLKDDNLYIGTIGHGLKVYNVTDKTVSTFSSATSQRSGNQIRSLFVDENCLWIGAQGEGLYSLDFKSQTIQKHVFDVTPQSRGIWSLAMDKDRNLWIGTDGSGLIIYSTETKAYTNYSYAEKNEQGLNDNTIRSILIENTGDAWLGTYVGGVNYHPNLPLKFHLYKQEFNAPLTLSDPSVMCFGQDGNRLWIGTSNGLNYMEDEMIYPYGKLLPASSKAETILALLKDKRGGLWIGTYDLGLFYLNEKKKLTRFVHDPDDKTSLSDNTAWALTQDSLGYIWVGTDTGPNRYDPKTNQFQSHANKPEGNIAEAFTNTGVRSLLTARDGSIWIGMYGDLVHYDYKTDQTSMHTDISDGNEKIEGVRVISLCEDENSNIWIGTYGDGLCKFESKSKTFSIINTREGLPNDFVLAIHAGTDNDLWMTTNMGILYHNIERGTFLTFDQNYGVQSNTFNRGSSCKLNNGDLAFGGVRGFNIFTPIPIYADTVNLNILLTDFKIYNESIRPGTELLPKSITELDRIELPYDESRSISIQYGALQFVAPGQVRYAYKLENFLTEWQNIGNNHTVTFTSLNPGTYKLLLRASLNEQTWGPEKKLTVIIRPPWYDTMLAKIIGGILLSLFIFALYHVRMRNLHFQKQKLETLVSQQSREIKDQNDELAAQNEELMQRNEEMASQKEMMADQNKILQETQRQMVELNESLEKLVDDRTKSLDDTIHQLNKTIRELDAFVYSASHDIIAPLKSIQGLISLSRMHTKENSESMTYLNYMDASIKKLDEIIKNMIQFSRNSKLEVKRENVNILKEIEQCIEDFQFMKGFEDIDFHIQVDPNVEVIADRQRLRIILSNLIGNAVKYYDPSKPVNEVSIRYENGNTTWKLYIHDNGIGIDKKYLSRVFEMFYRGTDKAYGSGLGLYIVKETVDRLKGEVFIDSEKGNWTKFELIFPIETLTELN